MLNQSITISFLRYTVKYLTNALKESLQSVLPIFAIVLVLSVTFAPMQSGVLVMFLFGTLLLILGMSFFTIGSGMSMQPLGEGIGAQLSRSKKMIIPIIVSFVLGILITIAEPDLQVLAEQMPAVPNVVLVMSVALGVGLFLVISVIRAPLTNPEMEQFGDVDVQEEKEIVTILASSSISGKIMEDVNREWGLRCEAKGMVCALPVDSAFKV